VSFPLLRSSFFLSASLSLLLADHCFHSSLFITPFNPASTRTGEDQVELPLPFEEDLQLPPTPARPSPTSPNTSTRTSLLLSQLLPTPDQPTEETDPTTMRRCSTTTVRRTEESFWYPRGRCLLPTKSGEQAREHLWPMVVLLSWEETRL